jgi:myo-inositol 2-dehydrogenase / D-chiro-inositol 1-dehydrogenase
LSKIKLGIVGLGYIGMLHLRHGLKLPNAEVVAVADTSPKALEKAHVLGVKNIYKDYNEMLKNPDVDAVVVSLPTHLHLKCSQAAAEAKKAVFLEKPISVTISEAKEIIALAERNSVKLMLGYPLRFNRHFIQVKEDLENGLLGEVENVHATYVCSGPFMHRADGHAPMPVPDWWFNTQFTGGGVLVDLGCHIINLLRYFFGEIIDIRGQFGYRYSMDFEDSAMCLARFQSGALAAINVGWYSQQYLLRVDLLGSVRTVTAEHMPPKMTTTAYQMLTKGVSSFNQPHYDELQYFVDCLQKDEAPSPNGYDGLRDLEAIAKAYNNRIIL